MSYNFIIEQGVIVSDTSLIKAEVEQEFKDIFGTNFVTDDDTPEGQLINQIVQVRKNVSDNNAQLANQINPNEAGGQFIDALWALTGGARTGPTNTTVDGILGGILDTIVPAGSIARDGTGTQLYILDQDVLLNITGDPVGIGTFSAVDSGPISLAVGALNTIVSVVAGWETILNLTTGNPGANVQSDISSRNERRVEVGLQGMSMAASVIANVQAVDFVKSLSFRDNVTGSQAVIDGITIEANSVWVSVDAGPTPTLTTKEDIARALLESKTGGADWTGTDVSVVIVDPNSGQSQTVKYDLTNFVPVLVQVTISSTSTTANPTQAVKDAVLAYALGEVSSEDPGLATGINVAPPEIGAAIGQLAPGVFTQKIEVSYDGPISYTQDLLDIELDERATIAESAVTVIIV